MPAGDGAARNRLSRRGASMQRIAHGRTPRERDGSLPCCWRWPDAARARRRRRRPCPRRGRKARPHSSSTRTPRRSGCFCTPTDPCPRSATRTSSRLTDFREVSGCIRRRNARAAHFELPVATFVVDDPQERATAGGEFAEPLDEDARAGTREHMLGDRQLDAAQFPKVILQCQHLAVGPEQGTLELSVTVRDHVSMLSVPVQWQRSGNTLQAHGEFTFTQSSLGLEPYSLLFGALRVSDEIRARYQLVARSFLAAQHGSSRARIAAEAGDPDGNDLHFAPTGPRCTSPQSKSN